MQIQNSEKRYYLAYLLESLESGCNRSLIHSCNQILLLDINIKIQIRMIHFNAFIFIPGVNAHL